MLLWVESQPPSIIALIVFGAAYLFASLIFCLAFFLSGLPIAKALQPVTPGILSPLGTILGILIAFLAVRVWTNLDHAQEHIGREVTALREVVMLADSLPADVRARVREAIGKHLEAVVSEDWPAMAEARISLRSFPPHLEEAMGAILSFAPIGANQQLTQNRALIAIEDAVEMRRNRVGVSRAEISPVQWTVIVVLAGMILVTIAAIHINARWAMALTLTIFSTAVAMCLVLLLVYDRPFGSGGFTLPPTAYREAMPD
jgi:hypothetical protein